MNVKLVLAAAVVSFVWVAPIAAAEAQSAVEEGTEERGLGKKQQEKQIRPHSHVEEKIGPLPKSLSKPQPKPPAARKGHDHPKFHK